LEAYVEMFQKIEHRTVGSALKQSIQQGLWSPTNATEYMERFIAFASGPGAHSWAMRWRRSAGNHVPPA
jgi:hypothetical protein